MGEPLRLGVGAWPLVLMASVLSVLLFGFFLFLLVHHFVQRAGVNGRMDVAREFSFRLSRAGTDPATHVGWPEGWAGE